MRTIKSSDEFFDLLDTIKGGCFVTIGYVTSANVELPIIKRKNPLTNRMKGYNDYSQFNREGSDDNIGALVKITSYNFNYRNRQSVHDEYFNRVKPETNKIRAEFGIDDVGTKDNYKSVMSYGANGQEVYSGKNEKLFGNSYSPQNMAKAIRINSKIYAVNTNGNIVRELDSSEVKFKAKKDPSGVAALRKMGADEDRIKQYIERINSLNFAYKNFEANSILYIVATVNGEKIVYINNNLQRTVEDIDINPQDFIAIAKEKYKQDIQEMRNIMKQNVIRLTESDLHRIVKESVSKILNEIGDTPRGNFALNAVRGRRAAKQYRTNMDTNAKAENNKVMGMADDTAWSNYQKNPKLGYKNDAGYSYGFDKGVEKYGKA